MDKTISTGDLYIKTGLAEKAFLPTKNITILSTNPASVFISGFIGSSVALLSMCVEIVHLFSLKKGLSYI